MLVGSDSEKGEVIGGVKIPHCTSGLGCQLLDLTGILDCGGIIQSSADGNAWVEAFLINAHSKHLKKNWCSFLTFLVDYDDTSDSLVTLHPFQRFFYFRLLIEREEGGEMIFCVFDLNFVPANYFNTYHVKCTTETPPKPL